MFGHSFLTAQGLFVSGNLLVVRSQNGLPEPSGIQDGGRGPGLLLRVQQGQEGEAGGPGSRDHRPRQGETVRECVGIVS